MQWNINVFRFFYNKGLKLIIKTNKMGNDCKATNILKTGSY